MSDNTREWLREYACIEYREREESIMSSRPGWYFSIHAWDFFVGPCKTREDLLARTYRRLRDDGLGRIEASHELRDVFKDDAE